MAEVAVNLGMVSLMMVLLVLFRRLSGAPRSRR
jgi:hypothetical protein